MGSNGQTVLRLKGKPVRSRSVFGRSAVDVGYVDPTGFWCFPETAMISRRSADDFKPLQLGNGAFPRRTATRGLAALSPRRRALSRVAR